MPAPDKAAQDTEARARADAGVISGEGADALSVVDDGAPGAEPGAAPRQPTQAEGEPQRTAPPTRSPKDDARNAIVGRFRENRGQTEEADDISEFARSGMPPEFAENNAAVVDPAPVIDPEPAAPAAAAAEPEPAAPAAPAKVKVKVRGREFELTQEEILAEAQKSLAGESYLAEGKAKLDEIDRRLKATPDPASQRGQTQQHPAAANNAETADAPQPGPQDPQHPEDKLGKLIEAIQFGDPGDARTLLASTIAEGATAAADVAVNRALENGRLVDEGARTRKVLTDFEEKHADIAKDPKARAVIEADVLEMQGEDLKALGIDLRQLRTDGQPPTPGDLSEAHKWYRAKGFKVRSPGEMLESGLQNYLEWRGVKTKPADPEPPANNGGVTVIVDRAARREAIPQQPGRTAAPRQEQRQTTPPPRDRSSIVQGEIARRNALRGKAV